MYSAYPREATELLADGGGSTESVSVDVNAPAGILTFKLFKVAEEIARETFVEDSDEGFTAAPPGTLDLLAKAKVLPFLDIFVRTNYKWKVATKGQLTPDMVGN